MGGVDVEEQVEVQLGVGVRHVHPGRGSRLERGAGLVGVQSPARPKVDDAVGAREVAGWVEVLHRNGLHSTAARRDRHDSPDADRLADDFPLYRIAEGNVQDAGDMPGVSRQLARAFG